MSGRASKAKGYRGEIEVLSILQQIVNEEYGRRGIPPPELARSPNGRDIRGLNWIALEVKRHEPTGAADSFTPYKINQWWSQCKTNTPEGHESVLIYRGNRMPWTVRMFARLHTTKSAVRTPVDIAVETFLLWFRVKLTETLPPPPSTIA